MPKADLRNIDKYEGKNILIIGAARSGVSAAKLACLAGAHVCIYDQKPLSRLSDAVEALRDTGVSWVECENQDDLDLSDTDILVISPGLPVEAPLVKKAQGAGIPVLGELEFAQTLNPCLTVAVTGTNGKTTTVSLLSEMYRQTGKVVHAAGNIGYPLSEAVLNCAPDDIVVVEVSSFQLETTYTFSPKAAAVLNVTEDHLNRHGTMEKYTALKRHIFDAQSENDYAVLNDDDPLTAGMASGLSAKVMLFSASHEVPCGAFVRDGQIMICLDSEEKRICGTDEIRIPGRHNLENALAAACIAFATGVQAAAIRQALRTFNGVEHRIESVRTVRHVLYINDSKGTNPDSTIRAIEAMKTGTVLILGGYDKHTSFDLLAKTVKLNPLIHDCVLMGDTAAKIEAALKLQDYRNIHMAGSLKDAVLKAQSFAAPGDNVLFSPACASFDMFTDYEDRGRQFKQIVLMLEE